MKGSRSAWSGDSRTRIKPPKSNTGALTAHVVLGRFTRMCRTCVVESIRYSIEAVTIGVLASGH